jgi:hypothetical protein
MITAQTMHFLKTGRCMSAKVRIRAISPSGYVSTIAGNGTAGSTDGPALQATFNQPYEIALFNDTPYISDTNNHKIRKISAGFASTFAGDGVIGSTD